MEANRENVSHGERATAAPVQSPKEWSGRCRNRVPGHGDRFPKTTPRRPHSRNRAQGRGRPRNRECM
jgi:hypothetical protein